MRCAQSLGWQSLGWQSLGWLCLALAIALFSGAAHADDEMDSSDEPPLPKVVQPKPAEAKRAKPKAAASAPAKPKVTRPATRARPKTEPTLADPLLSDTDTDAAPAPVKRPTKRITKPARPKTEPTLADPIAADTDEEAAPARPKRPTTAAQPKPKRIINDTRSEDDDEPARPKPAHKETAKNATAKTTTENGRTVKPRIIIQDEEEQLLGLDAPAGESKPAAKKTHATAKKLKPVETDSEEGDMTEPEPPAPKSKPNKKSAATITPPLPRSAESDEPEYSATEMAAEGSSEESTADIASVPSSEKPAKRKAADRATKTPAPAEDATPDVAAAQPEDGKYLLRYKFTPDETIRWSVDQTATVRTTVSGSTQTAETHSHSVKVWRVKSVDEGNATFVHSVEGVDMRQKYSNREEIHYNSDTDKTPPAGFETVAKAIGVPLAEITLDGRGNVIARVEKNGKPQQEHGMITIPLPEKPVAISESWTLPADVELPMPKGGLKKIKARQKFTLEDVADGIAKIGIETQILTPVNDPALEVQLVQRETTGNIRFDIAGGRVIGQQTELDKNVVGFQGEASSMHYKTKFVEAIMPQHDTATLPAPVAPESE